MFSFSLMLFDVNATFCQTHIAPGSLLLFRMFQFHCSHTFQLRRHHMRIYCKPLILSQTNTKFPYYRGSVYFSRCSIPLSVLDKRKFFVVVNVFLFDIRHRAFCSHSNTHRTEPHRTALYNITPCHILDFYEKNVK